MEGFDAPLGHPFLLDGLLEYLDVFLDSGTEVGFLDGELRLALGVLEGRDRTAGEPLVQCLIGRVKLAEAVDVLLDADRELLVPPAHGGERLIAVGDQTLVGPRGLVAQARYP